MISGIIYAILVDEYFYIGSSTLPIEERMKNHYSRSKLTSQKYSKLYKYIHEVRGGWDNIVYISLENVECKTLRELENIEYEYITKHKNDEYLLNILKTVNPPYIFSKYKKKFHK